MIEPPRPPHRVTIGRRSAAPPAGVLDLATRRIAPVWASFRRLRLIQFALLALTIPLAAATASAANRSAAPAIDVIQVQGLIDPAMAAYVRGSIERSAKDGATV